MILNLSIIILTFNEEKNIKDCLNSIKDLTRNIFIIDSFSTDNTLEICKDYTNKIYQNEFKSHSAQLKWALENLPITTEWVIRLDADERWTQYGIKELTNILEKRPDLSGIYVKMKIFFMGKWIKHGDFYPNLFLRVFKLKSATIEPKMVDEHIIIKGETFISNIDVIESNYDRQSDISLWITKHNKYSTNEAIDFIKQKKLNLNNDSIAELLGNKVQQKRWLKENLYNNSPLLIRPFIYYFYRYIIKLGFLDGLEGFIFHYLQGFWYRFLVDIKIFQILKRAKSDSKSVKEVIFDLYKISI